MDEATSNIDMHSDEMIQQAMKEKFSDNTVLTVAHRLNTVLESDRILVMENGKAAEFDTPENLLKKESKFKSLVKKSSNNSGLFD